MKINILYIFGGEKAQGAEIVIKRLIEHNLDAVNPHLFISPGDFADKLITEHKGYPVTQVQYLKKLNRSHTSATRFYLRALRNYFALSYQVYKYIHKNKIEIVHANTIVPTSYLLPLIFFSRMFKKPTKFVWSDHDLSYFSKIDNILSTQCVSSYNSTLVVSEAVKKKYPPNEKIKVLYNGLDTSVFKADDNLRRIFRENVQLDDSTIVIGMPAVVTPRKGQLGLIQAFNNLCLKYTNIKLLFAGGYEDATPTYSEQVRNAIHTNKNILHLGYVDNMIAFYNGCDVIVSNSSVAGSEPLGTTIYEAMACEKIVIAADTGGSGEIITNKVDGFLISPERIDELEQTLEYVITNYLMLHKMKLAAVQKAASKFNIESMKHQYNKILQYL